MFLCRGQRRGAGGVKAVPDPRLPFAPAQCAFLGQFEPSHVEKVTDGVQVSPSRQGLATEGTTHTAKPTGVIAGFQNILEAINQL